jgi:hypothetical protein
MSCRHRLTGWLHDWISLLLDIILSLCEAPAHSTVMISYDIIQQLLQNILARVQILFKRKKTNNKKKKNKLLRG